MFLLSLTLINRNISDLSEFILVSSQTAISRNEISLRFEKRRKTSERKIIFQTGRKSIFVIIITMFLYFGQSRVLFMLRVINTLRLIFYISDILLLQNVRKWSRLNDFLVQYLFIPYATITSTGFSLYKKHEIWVELGYYLTYFQPLKV